MSVQQKCLEVQKMLHFFWQYRFKSCMSWNLAYSVCHSMAASVTSTTVLKNVFQHEHCIWSKTPIVKRIWWWWWNSSPIHGRLLWNVGIYAIGELRSRNFWRTIQTGTQWGPSWYSLRSANVCVSSVFSACGRLFFSCGRLNWLPVSFWLISRWVMPLRWTCWRMLIWSCWKLRRQQVQEHVLFQVHAPFHRRQMTRNISSLRTQQSLIGKQIWAVKLGILRIQSFSGWWINQNTFH